MHAFHERDKIVHLRIKHTANRRTIMHETPAILLQTIHILTITHITLITIKANYITLNRGIQEISNRLDRTSDSR